MFLGIEIIQHILFGDAPVAACAVQRLNVDIVNLQHPRDNRTYAGVAHITRGGCGAGGNGQRLCVGLCFLRDGHGGRLWRARCIDRLARCANHGQDRTGFDRLAFLCIDRQQHAA